MWCSARGVPIRWIGYETTRTVLMTADDIARLRAGGKVARAVADIAAYYRNAPARRVRHRRRADARQLRDRAAGAAGLHPL